MVNRRRSKKRRRKREKMHACTDTRNKLETVHKYRCLEQIQETPQDYFNNRGAYLWIRVILVPFFKMCLSK